MAVTFTESTAITRIVLGVDSRSILVIRERVVTRTDDSTDPVTVTKTSDRSDTVIMDASDTSALVEGDDDYSGVASIFFNALPELEEGATVSRAPGQPFPTNG